MKLIRISENTTQPEKMTAKKLNKEKRAEIRNIKKILAKSTPITKGTGASSRIENRLATTTMLLKLNETNSTNRTAGDTVLTIESPKRTLGLNNLWAMLLNILFVLNLIIRCNAEKCSSSVCTSNRFMDINLNHTLKIA